MDRTLFDELRQLDHSDRLAITSGQTQRLAAQRNLIIYPGYPVLEYEDSVVSATALSADEFLTIAAGVGCRLLYLDAHHFRATDVTIADCDESQETFLRHILKQFDRHLMAIRLAFHHDGVWHQWTEQSAAADLLIELTEAANTGDMGASSSPHNHTDGAETGSRAWITADDIGVAAMDDLVQLIAADPQFRAGSQQKRHQVVRSHPAIKDYAGGDVPWRVYERATELVESLRRGTFDRFLTERADLAHELCATKEWADTNTRELRRQVTADFLRQRSGGFVAPRALREEVLALAHKFDASRACSEPVTAQMSLS